MAILPREVEVEVVHGVPEDGGRLSTAVDPPNSTLTLVMVTKLLLRRAEGRMLNERSTRTHGTCDV